MLKTVEQALWRAKRWRWYWPATQTD